MDYCVIAFSSTHAALSAQKTLEGVCPVQVMPVLREISSGCGISLRLPPEGLAAARAALEAASLPASGYAFYGVSGTGRTLRVSPLL